MFLSQFSLRFPPKIPARISFRIDSKIHLFRNYLFINLCQKCLHEGNILGFFLEIFADPFDPFLSTITPPEFPKWIS